VPATVLAFLVVGVGGAAGAMARFGLTMATLRMSAHLPVGTLLSNLLGCFIMGGLVEILSRITWLGEGGLITDHNRLLFGVGFCGAFTTLSSFVMEIVTMVQRNDVALAFGYLALTLAGGFAAFYGGLALTRAL
jgi:CrcB protein